MMAFGQLEVWETWQPLTKNKENEQIMSSHVDSNFTNRFLIIALVSLPKTPAGNISPQTYV